MPTTSTPEIAFRISPTISTSGKNHNASLNDWNLVAAVVFTSLNLVPSNTPLNCGQEHHDPLWTFAHCYATLLAGGLVPFVVVAKLLPRRPCRRGSETTAKTILGYLRRS
jgi:hypothetical protein